MYGGASFYGGVSVDLDRRVVIWAMHSGKRMRAGSSLANISPIPLGAIPIVDCLECEKRIMLKWIQKRLDRRWSVARIREACGG